MWSWRRAWRPAATVAASTPGWPRRSRSACSALLPAVADAVRIPVVATGGIADARGVAAAFALGASAVQVGTGFLRAPEAGLARRLGRRAGQRATPEGTVPDPRLQRPGRPKPCHRLRASGCRGRWRRLPAPYPVQRGLTAALRQQGRGRRRRAAHAGLGRPGRGTGPRPARRRRGGPPVRRRSALTPGACAPPRQAPKAGGCPKARPL
jgi:hypothetical protein